MMLLDVTVKTLKEAIRQPRNLAIGLGLPVAFMVIFGLAFGGEDAANATYEIAVLDHDDGAASEAYVSGLANLTYDDGTPLVRTTRVTDLADARRQLEDRTFHALVELPANFTAGLTPGSQPVPPATPLGQPSSRPTPPPGTSITLRGDPSTQRYNAASQVIAAYTQEFAARAGGGEPLVAVESDAVLSQELTDFDFIAPGLMVFAILNLAPQAAGILARETELKTLDRLKASPARAATVLAGVVAAQLVLAAVSLALMLGAAAAMGFHNQGSYGVAYLIALMAAVPVAGIGMVIASFARTQQEAANFGVLVSVPASFLSGSFFVVPGIELFRLGSRSVGLYDLLPTTHAVDLMRDVMTFGRGLDDVGAVAYPLAALAILGLAYFAVGAALYARFRLRPE